jgi:homoserine kinase
VPASTSNLGPGFDCLGLALELTLRVEVTRLRTAATEIKLDGPEMRGLPDDASNLTLVALQDTLQRLGGTPGGLRLRIHNEIPIARGLGSSGAAITAGITAGHLLAAPDEPSRAAILEAAVRLEGHPDNVAPQVWGGFIAAATTAEGVHTVRLPLPPQLEIVLVVPEYEVPTREARRILPDPVRLEDAVFNLSRVALLCGALQNNDDDTLRVAMQDRLHERYRASLVPGLEAALASLRADPRCVASALSGSGPTLVAFYRDVPPDAAQDAVAELERHDVAARVRRVRPRAAGVEWQRQDD